MTVSRMAAPARPTASPESAYVPGACNIGADEIAHRRRAGHIGVIVTVTLFVLLIAVGAPPWLRFVVIGLTAAGAAAGYIQAWLKFCAAFGWAGVLNFGRRGRTDRVEDRAARARDRMRALQIGAASGLVGLVVGLVAALWP